jgi:hypothetical protein
MHAQLASALLLVMLLPMAVAAVRQRLSWDESHGVGLAAQAAQPQDVRQQGCQA